MAAVKREPRGKPRPYTVHPPSHLSGPPPEPDVLAPARRWLWAGVGASFGAVLAGVILWGWLR